MIILKNISRNHYILLTTLILGVLFVSASSGGYQVEQNIEARELPMYMLQSSNKKTYRHISGTVVPLQKSIIRSEVSGTVSRVFASEGDNVSAHQTIITVNSDRERVMFNSMKKQFASLEIVFNSRKNIENYALSILDDSIDIVNIKEKTAQLQQTNVKDKYVVMEKESESREEELSKSLSGLRAKKRADITAIYSQSYNTVTSTHSSVSSALNFVNNVLDMPGYDVNYDFETILGNNHPGSKAAAISQLSDSSGLYNQFNSTQQSIYRHRDSLSNSEWDTILNRADYMAKSKLETLRLVKKALDATDGATSTDLPLAISSITKHQSSILSSQKGVESILSEIKRVSSFYDAKIATARESRITASLQRNTLNNLEKIEKTRIDGELNILEKQELQAQDLYSSGKYQKKASLAEIIGEMSQLSGLINISSINLAKASVRTPFSGVIVDRLVEVGELVSTGTELFTVAGNQRQILIYVDQNLISHLSKGDILSIQRKGNMKMTSGTVKRIYPSITDNTHTVPVEITLSEDIKWIIGTVVLVDIPITEKSKQGEFSVPKHYVGFAYDGPFVETKNGRRHNVVIADDTGDSFSIISTTLKFSDWLRYPKY